MFVENSTLLNSFFHIFFLQEVVYEVALKILAPLFPRVPSYRPFLIYFMNDGFQLIDLCSELYIEWFFEVSTNAESPGVKQSFIFKLIKMLVVLWNILDSRKEY